MNLKRPARLAFAIVSIVVSMALACAGQSATPTPTPQTSSTAIPTRSPQASSTAAPPTSLVPAPTNVHLSGRLPDTKATVPPGEGEAGRVTVQWDAQTGADGFRIYLKDCSGSITRALEVDGATRQYGPLQPCRPGGAIGVSAFNGGGESAIVWTP